MLMMKTILLSLAVIALVPQLRAADGLVLFANNSPTAVTNSLTGTNVPSGNTFHVALYVAPDGTTNDWMFTYVAGSETNFLFPGRFNRGGISTPIPAGTYGMFQVRVWETAYGSTYEQAVGAPLMNGRLALVVKSVIMRVLPTEFVPTPLTASGLDAIRVTPLPPPSFSINSILVSEGTNGTRDAVFSITLSPPVDTSASIDFATLDGTALAGSDYVATNGTVTFAPGQMTNSISITLTPDVYPEDDEQFFVTLTNNVGALIAQGVGTCVITEVRVLGVRMDVAVTFNTVVGHHYIVERTDDLSTWTTVPGAQSVAGTGSTATIYDQGAGGQLMRLYRARLLD